MAFVMLVFSTTLMPIICLGLAAAAGTLLNSSTAITKSVITARFHMAFLQNEFKFFRNMGLNDYTKKLIHLQVGH
jgi:hypothetical protein